MSTCIQPGCRLPHKSKGLCNGHYQRSKGLLARGIKRDSSEFEARMSKPVVLRPLGPRKVKHPVAARVAEVNRPPDDDEIRLRVPLKTSEWDRLKQAAKVMNLVLPDSAPRLDPAMIIAIIVRKHFGWRE